MSINEEAMEKIEKLRKQYRETWGEEAEILICPPDMTQERLASCLEWMLRNYGSLLTAYSRLYGKRPPENPS